ncbi:MAG: phosphate signaling complex protein PhoU [Planctomycetota bacterium]|nr:phosphate signaling complex protein PhoU [Planctomycetota bacterium]MDA1211979.1 phosphate signaling complex protein PhoU [Planctomycetota bacterium]
MSIHLIRDLDSLQHDILSMCAMVEDVIHRAVVGLKNPSEQLANELALKDDEIDKFDVRIEEECLKILALHQPVAMDLRRIATVMKITGELERVADLGVHIAERGCGLIGQPEIQIPDGFDPMVRHALQMLQRSIDSYVELDTSIARSVCSHDSIVDRLNREIIAELVQLMHESPHQIESAIHLFSASRHVERVADHATNIAEDVVYLVEGEIIRHRKIHA